VRLLRSASTDPTVLLYKIAEETPMLAMAGRPQRTTCADDRPLH